MLCRKMVVGYLCGKKSLVTMVFFGAYIRAPVISKQPGDEQNDRKNKGLDEPIETASKDLNLVREQVWWYESIYVPKCEDIYY